MFDTNKEKIRAVLAKAVYEADEHMADESSKELCIDLGPSEPWETLHEQIKDGYLFRAERAIEALFKHLKENTK